MGKTSPPPRTAKSIRIDNLNNRIAGTADLVEKAQANIQGMKTQIQTRIKLRAELLESIREYSDYRDHVNKDRKAFEQEITEAKASIAELEDSVAEWTTEIKILQLKLSYAEQMPT